MLVKFGPVIVAGRGKVGGVIASRNSAGAYMKQWTKPTWSAYPKQVNINSLLSIIINNWKTVIGFNERAAWNALAAVTPLPNKLGEMFTPSGFNLYVRSNMMLDLSGQGFQADPPLSAVAPAPQLTLEWETLVGVKIVSIGNWDATPPGKVFVQWHPLSPFSVNYYKGPYPESGAAAFATYAAVPVTILPSGFLTPNSRTFWRFRAVHWDGMVSAPVYLKCDVGTPV